MSVTVSPNRYTPWYQVLEALGFDVEVTALPARAICPFCRSATLRIYEDSKFGGAWHHCERCKTAGDSITLASKVWKLSLTSTLHRLSTICAIPEESLTPESINNYLRLHHGKQEAAAKLRTLAASRLTTTEDTRQLDLIKHFNLDSDRWSKDWASRFGPYCGVATPAEVYDNIRPSRQADARLGRPDHGMLAIPFNNLPGRISGYLITAKDKKQALKIRTQFIPVTNSTEIAVSGQYKYIDPGLAMYDTLTVNNFASMYGKTAFVGPIMHALRLQGSHLRDSRNPLPILGVYQGVQEIQPGRFRRYLPYDVWKAMAHRHFVFWAETPDAAVFNMAARCQGAVAWYQRWDKGQAYISTQFLHQLQKIARPWQEVLERVLLAYPVQRQIRLMQELDLPANALDEFRRDCSPKALAVLSSAVNSGKMTTSLAVGRHRVISTDSGWYAEPGQRLISSGRLAIEKVLTKYDDGCTYYQGKIVNRGGVVSFLEKADVVEHKTLDWMQKTLVAGGARPMQYDPTWSHKIVPLAMGFLQPVSVRGAGRYGWNNERGAFVFPRFTLAVGGRVDGELFHIEDAMTPAALLPNPESTLPQIAPLLSKTLESEVFWASMAALAANVIAPALNQLPAGIGLCGLGAAYAGRMTAKAIGCVTYHPHEKNHQSIINSLLRATNAHSWPVMLDLPKRWGRSHVAAWLNDTSEKNVLMEVDRTLLAALKVQTNWRFVSCETPLTNTNAIETHGQTILPAWLLDLCQRKLQLVKAGDVGLARHVLVDMADWVTRLGHDDSPLRYASRLLEDTDSTETDVARYFTQTICRLVDEGKLECIKAGFETHDYMGCSYHDDDKTGFFIPRAVVNKMLLNEGLPLIDPAAVTVALAEAGVLEQELEYRSYKGWLVNSAWWHSQMKLYRALRDRILRIVG